MRIESRRIPVSALALFALLAVQPALALWSDDPVVNLAVADRTGWQTVPLVASTSDGGTWVAWFDPAAGNYDVYVQLLDAAGAESFAHNGLLVSDHPQDSALYGWDMIADSSDNAVLVFSDIRDGGDLDVFAYKIAPDGTLPWGPDGVQISANDDFDPAPRVAEASNGDIVVVWQRDPASGDGDVRMQRLTAAGTPLFAAGGIPVAAEAGKDPGFVGIAASDGGSVVLSWVRDIRSFLSDRYVRAEKFTAAGASDWGAPVEVFDAYSVPIGYFPKILSDGAGGAIVLWHRSDGTLFNSFVQRLDSSGAELFAHNGVAVSTTPGMFHLDPTMSLDPVTGDVLVFWNERNTLQSQWGIFGQKISPAGARSWGDGGKQLLPVNTTYKSFPRSVQLGDDAVVVLVDQPSGSDRLLAMRVDTDGTVVWGSTLSSVAASKSRYPVTIDGAGVVKVAWEDGRNASVDIYAQNVRPDGSLGASVEPGRSDGLVVERSSLTPGDLTLAWQPSCSSGATDYGIYEGTMGDWSGYQRKDCTDDGGDRIEEVHPAAGDTFYLVVPLTATTEGSYGTGAGGAERPPSSISACRATQSASSCP